MMIRNIFKISPCPAKLCLFLSIFGLSLFTLNLFRSCHSIFIYLRSPVCLNLTFFSLFTFCYWFCCVVWALVWLHHPRAPKLRSWTITLTFSVKFLDTNLIKRWRSLPKSSTFVSARHKYCPKDFWRCFASIASFAHRRLCALWSFRGAHTWGEQRNSWFFSIWHEMYFCEPERCTENEIDGLVSYVV